MINVILEYNTVLEWHLTEMIKYNYQKKPYYITVNIKCRNIKCYR